MNVPQSVMVSAYHRFAERWALMLDFGWQQWSQFGKVDIGVVGSGGTLNTTATIDYQDTYHGAVGIRYRLNPAWLINSGFAYDSSMVSDQNRTVTVPIGEAFRFGLGAEWQASPKFNVAFSYELAYGGNLPVNQNRGPLAGAVVGQYPGTYFNFFQVSVIWGTGESRTTSKSG
jgi:long-chain fatty acid transport protein